MKIQKINLLQMNSNVQIRKNDSQNSNNSIENYSYKPFAYQDFNVNFGAKLEFKTFEDFRSHKNNSKYMPQTMKDFYAEFKILCEDMTPEEIMAESYSDIDKCKSLEDVKKKFPNEPLFKNLTSTPKHKVRAGIIAEMNKNAGDSNVSLFKNGSNDLGLYVLKKIYLEGKTLDEINEDFKKDRSVKYESAPKIEDSDIYEFGIRRPENSFWLSFINTRDDYRKIADENRAIWKELRDEDKTSSQYVAQTNKSDGSPSETVDSAKKTRVRMKDYEVKNIVKDIVDKNPSAKRAKSIVQKKMEKADREEKQRLSFVQQYMSEIMSVATDKINLSDELKYFNASDKVAEEMLEEIVDVENNAPTHETSLSRFWKNNPELKLHFSDAIKDSITLFQETYELGAQGEEGESEPFAQLVEHAQNLKPLRKLHEHLHEMRQTDIEQVWGEGYDKYLEFKDFIKMSDLYQANKLNVSDVAGIDKEENYIIVESKMNSEEEVKPKTTEEKFYGMMKAELSFLPDRYLDKYFKFSINHPLFKANGKQYIEALETYIMMTYPTEEEQRLYSEISEISPRILEDFAKKHYNDYTAAMHVTANYILENASAEDIIKAMTDAYDEQIQQNIDNPKAIESLNVEKEYLHKDSIACTLFRCSLYQLTVVLHKLDLSKPDARSKNIMERDLKRYSKENLTSDEKVKISNFVVDYIKKYDMPQGNNEEDIQYRLFIEKMKTILVLGNDAKIKNMIKTEIVEKHANTAKSLLYSTSKPEIKNGKADSLIKNLIEKYFKEIDDLSMEVLLNVHLNNIIGKI